MAEGNLAKKSVSNEERRQAAYSVWANFKEQVKDQYAIDQAIEDFTGMRLEGRPGQGDRKGKCPFHNDTNPSMNVRPQEGYFRCHTAGCEARGDVFSFISQYMNVSFKQAVLMAAERAGITPPNGATANTASAGTNAPRKPKYFENHMNPAKLFESDLVPAFKGIRKPQKNRIFPVWHPGGGRTIEPCVKNYKPQMVHVYRSMTGHPLMVVLRCLHRDGGKYFMPIRVGQISAEAPKHVVDGRSNNTGWIVKGTTPGHRKPIYGMEEALDWFAKNGKRILIVEGEKTCDAARRMIGSRDDAEDWLILSPMGGHNASLYADWTAFMEEAGKEGLSGVTFAVWPDADHIKSRPDGSTIDAQELYVRDTIGAFVTAMRKAGMDPNEVSYRRALPGTDRENGWDLADAEREEWDGDRVVSEIDEEGMPVAIEKRYLELEVDITDDGDPAPFEDGPEGIDHLTLPDLEDEEEEDAIEALLRSDDDSFMPGDDVEDAIILDAETATTHVLDGAGDAPLGATFDRPVEADEIVTVGEDGEIDDDIIDDDGGAVNQAEFLDNHHFRALGFRDGAAYFMSLRGGEITAIPIASMKKQSLFGLAPLRFWNASFSKFDQRGNQSTDWDEAMSALVEASYNKGMWDPQKEAGQGARIDLGRVVFNTGDRLWVQTEPDGDGELTTLSDFNGEYQYTVGDSCGLPDFENSFKAGDIEPMKLLELIQNINWRDGSEKMSAMALFGWLCIGPICGVLPWRPHLWLDGQRAAGKSWIIENIIKPTLCNYAILVKSNSTESGLRNVLHGRAFPLVFDEAEGEMDGDRNRMGAVLRMARHSATPGDSVVAQGVPGGAGQKFFSISSTFLLSSITPQLEASADKTRFARARLGPGHGTAYFSQKLEGPAQDLLNEEFSPKMIGRMVKRAGSITAVQKLMVRALTACNVERRMADVWGTYAAGAWCLLEDGIPEDFEEALAWIDKTFGILDEIRDVSDEISDDKDHANLFRNLMAHEVRCETIHLGTRTFNLGSIIQMAITESDEDEEVLDRKQAGKRLAEIGIRLGHKGAVAKVNEKVDCLLIHKNSPRISEILSRTPYAASYVDVIQQAENVKNGGPTRFGGLGTHRSVIVPLEHFPVSSEEDEHGDEGTDGGS
jgi:putative DNA primase/helicase